MECIFGNNLSQAIKKVGTPPWDSGFNGVRLGFGPKKFRRWDGRPDRTPTAKDSLTPLAEVPKSLASLFLGLIPRGRQKAIFCNRKLQPALAAQVLQSAA
jgi:hypothetical protein